MTNQEVIGKLKEIQEYFDSQKYDGLHKTESHYELYSDIDWKIEELIKELEGDYEQTN